jgi:serine/threonine-protein kinase
VATLDGSAITQFGKYQLFASLGRGGMADVFLSVARGQMGFNKLAVIKRLRPALADDQAFRTMFLDEAKLAARLNHPNIVHTYEVGEHEGQYFIAMEYLEGQALNKVVKESIRAGERIAPEIAVRMISDALAGLGHAHELRDYDGRPLNVIHRDISPHNLFVTYDGHTKLVDFGIAKADSSTTETEIGVLKGKVAYMSPEQAMGQRLDQRADLFSMGVALWELLAQKRLFTGDNAANIIHKLMNEPIPRCLHAVPDLDPELDRLVMVALEKDPERRFQTAAEFRDALEGWLRQHRARQEDVSRVMNGLFGVVRAEVQKQVQRHMALIAPAKDTAELQAITADNLQGLIRLGMNGGGSGSGVVANYGGVASPPSNPPSNPGSAYPSFPPSTPSMSSGQYAPPYQSAPGPEQPRSNALLITITIGCFVLAALLIVVFGFKKQLVPAAVQPPAPSVTVAAVEPSAAPADSAAPTAEPITIPTVTEVSPKTTRPTGHVVSPPVKPGPVTKPAPAPSPSEEPGSVTLSAYPYAKVSEGSKVICAATPCNRVSMSPGPHTLTFENGVDPSQKQTVTVVVKSGENTPKTIGFK